MALSIPDKEWIENNLSGGRSSNIIVDLDEAMNFTDLFNNMQIPYYPNALYYIASLDEERNESNVSINSMQFGFKNGSAIASPLDCYRVGNNSPYNTLLITSGTTERFSPSNIINDNGVLKYTPSSSATCKGRWICSIANFDE